MLLVLEMELNFWMSRGRARKVEFVLGRKT